jgi:hypothetical protein
MDALTQLGSIERETSVRLEMSFLYFVVEREVLFLGIKTDLKGIIILFDGNNTSLKPYHIKNVVSKIPKRIIHILFSWVFGNTFFFGLSKYPNHLSLVAG